MHGLVVSDLHLLTSRSLGRRWQAGFERELRSCALLVLNGDIFDFHWSRLGEPTAGLAFAEPPGMFRERLGGERAAACDEQ